MKRHLLIFIFSVVCLATAFAQAPQQTEVPASKITEGQIQIIGILGKTLGEKVTISGKGAAETMMVSNPLAIKMVDRKPVKKTILIEVQGMKVKEGVDYTLVGYETGVFNSTPQWTVEAPVQQPFRFITYFVVVKVVENKQQ